MPQLPGISKPLSAKQLFVKNGNKQIFLYYQNVCILDEI